MNAVAKSGFEFFVKHKNICLVVFFFLCGAVFFIPNLAGYQTYFGEDSYFHLHRIISLENAFVSPINFDFWEHGPIVNNFYPYITIYPSYILYYFIGDVYVALSIYICLISTATAFIAYYVMKSLYRNSEMAIAFAILYTFCAYRIVNMVIRGAFGELISMTFLPLVMLGCINILLKNYKKWYILTIGMSLIAYSHILSLYITSGFVLIFVVIAFCINNEKRQRLIALVKAGMLSILFTLPATVPMVVNLLKLDIFIPPYYGTRVASFSQVIFSSLKNSFVSYYTVGTTVLILIVLCAIRFPKIGSFARGSAIFGSLIIISSSTLLPWDWIFRFDFAKSIQFPFRLLSIASLLVVFAGAIALYSFKRKHISRSIFGIIIVSFLVVSYAFIGENPTHIDGLIEKNIYERVAKVEPVKTLAKDVYYHDYWLEKFHESMSTPTPEAINFYNDGKIEEVPKDFIKTKNIASFTYENKAEKPIELTIPLQNYLEASLLIDGTKSHIRSSKWDTIIAKIPPGKHKVEIKYENTLIWKISVGLSLLSIVAFLIIRLLSRFLS